VAEYFVYQSLKNNKEAKDMDEFNQPGVMNELGGAMNKPKESELLPPFSRIWDCQFITKCTGVCQNGCSYAGWK
jgi:hypothetical protein